MIREERYMNTFRKAASALLAMAMLSACGTSSAAASTAEPAGKFTPGTYDATAAGRNGDVTLHVTFDANSITDITSDNAETDGIGTTAIEELTKQTLENQAVPADTVSGATISSNAYLEALKDAITQAGGDPESMVSTAAASTEEAADYVTDADIIIVGAGAAGMTAAVTAGNAGASVVLLEKSGKTGGNTPAAANGINAADSEVQLADETYTSANASAAGLEELQLQNEEARENLVDAFAENSGEVINWLSDDLGVEFETDIQEDPRNPVTNYYMLQARKDGSTGITLTNAVAKALENTDVNLYTNMTTHDLVQDENGTVTGVVATDANGNDVTFTGKAVLLATGGFGKNQELLAEVAPRLANATTDEIAPTTGDGLLMAEAVGAKTVDLDQIQTFPVVAEGYGMVTPNKLPGGFQVDAIVVNDNAERFAPEGFEMVDAVLSQPDGNAYMIFDEGALNDDIQNMIDGGYIQEAGTAEELAVKLNLDPDTLRNTVDAYNEDVADGTDDAFGKEGAQTLEGNLYGFKYGVGAHYFMGGVLINENTQVLDENENPIPGLYAAGEVTGGFHGTQRIDGSGIGDSFVFGRIAGRTIGENVK